MRAPRHTERCSAGHRARTRRAGSSGEKDELVLGSLKKDFAVSAAAQAELRMRPDLTGRSARSTRLAGCQAQPFWRFRAQPVQAASGVDDGPGASPSRSLNRGDDAVPGVSASSSFSNLGEERRLDRAASGRSAEKLARIGSTVGGPNSPRQRDRGPAPPVDGRRTAGRSVQGLPVHQRFSAATPGRSLPSSHSRKAPPAVEM